MSTATNTYLSEYERLKTFQNGWPHSFLSAEVMAKCGFYYLGVNDKVKCPFCNVVVFNWSIGDEPIREHIRTSGRCRFVNGYDVGNIFIGDDPREIFDLNPGEDVCGLITSKKAESNQIDSNEPGIPYREPNHLDYITYDSRLTSYKDWTSENIAPTKLAEAGFFFRGIIIVDGGYEVKDAVTCFHCGESLSGWTKDDNAWEEHAKFSPKCSFIFLLAAFETSRMHQNTVSSTFLPYSWLSKATDENRCSVCFEFSVSISFNPCAHSTCSICAAALLKCPICRSNIKRLTKISKEPSALEPLTVEPLEVQPLAIESPKAESPTVPSSNVESSSVELPAADSPILESATVDTATVVSPTVELPAAELPILESPTVDTATVVSPTVELTAAELPILESPTVESSTMESAAVDSPVVESSSAGPHVQSSPEIEFPTSNQLTVESASKEMTKKTESQSAIEQPKESSQSSPSILII